MKRLVLIFLSIYLSICSCFAYTTSPYQGTFSSSLLNVLRDVAENVSPMPYVAWRDDEYTYCLFYSDTLECSGTVFTADEGVCVSVSSVSGDGYYNNYIDYYSVDFNSFELSTNNILVYSNLPGFPTLSEKEVIYLDTFLLFAVVIVIFLVINRLMRSRVRR